MTRKDNDMIASTKGRGSTMKMIRYATLATAGLAAAIAVAGCKVEDSGGGSTKDTPISAAPAAPSAAPSAPVPNKNVIDGDGTFKVGDQLNAGTYRTTVPAGGMCYYARLKDASGELDAIIANGLGERGTQQVVKIVASDAFFKTDGCGTWRKIS